MRSGDVFQGQYLKADDILGKRVKVTVEDVRMEDIGKDDKKERRAVAHFVGKDRGLVLNRTNWTILEDVCGSTDSDDWAGYTVTLYTTKVDFQGKRVPAIRVGDQPGDTTAPARASRAASQTDDDGEPERSSGDITDEDVPF